MPKAALTRSSLWLTRWVSTTILRLTKVTKNESTKAVNDRPHSVDPSDRALVADRAGTSLQNFIDHRGVLRKEGTMWRPFIIFSFDEAHDLTKLNVDDNWSIYLALRSCLTHLVASSHLKGTGRKTGSSRFFFSSFRRPEIFAISPQRYYGTLPVGFLVAVISFYLPSLRLASVSSHSPSMKARLHWRKS